jgi:ribosomal protein S9
MREERKGAKLKVEKRLLCEWKIQKIDVEVVTISGGATIGQKGAIAPLIFFYSKY